MPTGSFWATDSGKTCSHAPISDVMMPQKSCKPCDNKRGQGRQFIAGKCCANRPARSRANSLLTGEPCQPERLPAICSAMDSSHDCIGDGTSARSAPLFCQASKTPRSVARPMQIPGGLPPTATPTEEIRQDSSDDEAGPGIKTGVRQRKFTAKQMPWWARDSEEKDAVDHSLKVLSILSTFFHSPSHPLLCL